ncbi:hypothetical protein ACIBFB_07220 [Nocardiopsis sp. NPDC050513]|uniref:hypothetical protein n=1 Tax=Nocardiopsis sp. NPDC050513 TaxID=3364338 RepID=UPI003799A6CD
MLSVVCAVVLLLYAARFVVTELLDRSGVHPRSLPDFHDTLNETRWSELRENPLSMGRSAVLEKSAVLDNMVGMANYRTFSDAEELAPDLSEKAEARIAEYSAMVAELDGEIADSVEREQKTSSTGGAGRTEERRRVSMRYVHAACMAVLVALLVSALFVG